VHIVLAILTLRTGGAERDICRVAGFLAHQHKVTIVTLIVSGKERPFYAIDPSVSLVQLDLMRSIQDSLGFWGRARELCLRPFCLWRYRAALRNLKADVIISYLTKSNILTLLAARGLKVHVIASKRVDTRLLPYSRGLKALRSYAYKRADLIVTQTARIADTLRGLKVPVTVIPNAVVPSKRYTSPSKSVTTLVSIGRLTEQKDFPTLLRAFRKVHRRYPVCQLYIYGEGPDRTELQQFIEELHMRGSIFLSGITSNVEDVLFKTDLFISSTRYEGFPNALAEAMAMGVPVIASDIPENKALVSDTVNGRLFPVGDSDRLAELTEELICDFKQRQSLGLEARKIVQRFSLRNNHLLWQKAIDSVTVGTSKTLGN
jgi:glycosyltransferase involved in cell wall biosynthesis